MKIITTYILFFFFCIAFTQQKAELTVNVFNCNQDSVEGKISVYNDVGLIDEKYLINGSTYFLLKEVSGINETENQALISIQPNPVYREYVTLRVKGIQYHDAIFNFYNISGKKLGRITSNDINPITLTNAQGTILYQFISDNTNSKWGKIISLNDNMTISISSNTQPFSCTLKSSSMEKSSNYYTIIFTDNENNTDTIGKEIHIPLGRHKTVYHNLDYVSLEYTDFMHLAHAKIADSIKVIMNLNTLSYNQKVSIGMLFNDELKQFNIKEGYEYLTDNGAKITIWVDSNNDPCLAAYILNRPGKGQDWSFSQDSVEQIFRSKLKLAGGDSINLDSLQTTKRKTYWDDHYYEIFYRQKYFEDFIEEPYFFTETDGDKNKINTIVIRRFYSNIDDVTCTLSDQELKLKAVECYKTYPDIISLPGVNNLQDFGYWIINDRLCKKIGSARIDVYGSTRDLYVDIQNGEVIWETEILVD
jgi:hypothetical protein